MRDYSMYFVLLPLKTPLNGATKNNESIHTFGVDVRDGPLKGQYELARDKRVAEIHEMFKRVQEAAKAL